MKKYKVTSSNVIFTINGKEYNTKEGEVLDLPETHITVRALVERSRLEEFDDDATPATQTQENAKVADLETAKKPETEFPETDAGDQTKSENKVKTTKK